MIEEELLAICVGSPCPDALRPSALGVGLKGSPDELFLIFHEEFRPVERSEIETGDYLFALKLYQRERVAGLVWSLFGRELAIGGYANYSLRHVRESLGEEDAESFRQSTRSASLAGSPDCGLLIRVVFVEPADGTVFALRLFTLPRLFSDRFLAAILATDAQDPDRSDELVEEMILAGSKAWDTALPGIAVAGKEQELDAGDFARLLRKQRSRRDRR